MPDEPQDAPQTETPQPPTEDSSNSSSSAASSQKRVLIVEDERPLSHALELKLTNQGFSVMVAHDGAEALEALKNDSFDVMLLDLVMPTVDGFQVLQHLQSTPHAPIVFVLSNLSQHEDEERARALGATKFFIKSDIPLSEIVEEIKNT